jgi:hypothetical protein
MCRLRWRLGRRTYPTQLCLKVSCTRVGQRRSCSYLKACQVGRPFLLSEATRETRTRPPFHLRRNSVQFHQAQAKLAALGYVATDSNASKAGAAGANEQGADPKDKIEIANLIHRTYLLIEDQRYQEAVPMLRQASPQPRCPS